MFTKTKALLTIIVPTFLCVSLASCSSGTVTSNNSSQENGTARIQVSQAPSPTPQPTVTPIPSIKPVESTPTPIVRKIDEAEKYYEQGYTLFMNQSKYDESIKYFNKAIEADPLSYKAYNGKGIALCFKGSYNEGMRLIDKSLSLKPDFAYANFNKALAYKLQKDYDNSLIWFNETISLDPKDTWSYYGISTIYADRNDVAMSLEYLKKAVELDPSVKSVAKSQDHFARMRNNEEFIKITK